MRDSEDEKIPDRKIEEIEERLSNLPKDYIDELFHRAGFKVAKGQGKYKPRKYQRIDKKALTPHQLDKIKEKDSAIVENMLLETPLDVVLTNLEELEKRKE